MIECLGVYMNLKLKSKKVINKIIVIFNTLFYYLVPLSNKKILFVSYHGKGYLCNPKAIHQYMSQCEDYRDFQFVWALKKGHYVNIPNAKVVRYNSLQYFYYLARSKYWIFNCKMPGYLRKKKNQIYLQTWHGTPLKRLAHDINIKEGATFYRSRMSHEQMTHTYNEDRKKYDYFLSSNSFATEKFISAFKINPDKILEVGYPRNDFLTQVTLDEIENLKNKYDIPLTKKVILYAPTWRDNSFNERDYVHEVQVNFSLWKQQLGEEYVVIYKPHYLIVNYFNETELDGFLYPIAANIDINELYVISDVLVTDYSSVFFDYAILNRPILFYMYDLLHYEHELRGFYLDVNTDLPGAIITEEASLLHQLQNIDHYQEENAYKLKQFNANYNELQTGDCAKKVVESIIRI